MDFKGFGDCDTCGKLISAPADAVISIDRREALSYPEGTPGEVIVVHSIPPRVRWQVTHLGCAPSDGDIYTIGGRSISDSRGVMAWTLHLMQKSWLRHTRWEALVRRLFKVGGT